MRIVSPPAYNNATMLTVNKFSKAETPFSKGTTSLYKKFAGKYRTLTCEISMLHLVFRKRHVVAVNKHDEDLVEC